MLESSYLWKLPHPIHNYASNIITWTFRSPDAPLIASFGPVVNLVRNTLKSEYPWNHIDIVLVLAEDENSQGALGLPVGPKP